MKKTIFTTILIPIVSYAGWFGPSNFQDCVLEGMKGVNGDQAAKLVAMACRQKFPEKATPPTPAAEVRELHSFSAATANRPSLNALILKIESNGTLVESHGKDFGSGVKSADFGYHLVYEVINRNDFQIFGIEVGIPKRPGACSWSAQDYSEIYDCDGQARENQSGKFRCDIPRIEKRKLATCIIGFTIYGTSAEIKEFMSKKNIPARNGT
jgi:hypothetical protein